MAKNFGKSPAAKRFDEIAEKTMINTDNTVIKLIKNDLLKDFPENGEDITYTADIENSIKELGFTDPIEVTDFGMFGLADGEYMILSGHRRRAAGVKCGMDLFPCIVKSFDDTADESDVKNYVLLSNSQRDSARDPLLYSSRYKMHEKYLKSINFKGSVREEVAGRLGLSVQQADRYNQMNKIIEPVWDYVRAEIVGMSSVLPMAVLDFDEQMAVFTVMKDAVEDGVVLTREKVREIIDLFRESPHREDFGDIEDIGDRIKTGKADRTEEYEGEKIDKRLRPLRLLKSINAQLGDLQWFFERGIESDIEKIDRVAEELVKMKELAGNVYDIIKYWI